MTDTLQDSSLGKVCVCVCACVCAWMGVKIYMCVCECVCVHSSFCHIFPLSLTHAPGEEIKTLDEVRDTLHLPIEERGVIALDREERFFWPVMYLNYSYTVQLEDVCGCAYACECGCGVVWMSTGGWVSISFLCI